MNTPPMTEDRIQQECSMWFKNTYKEYRNLFFMINNAGTKTKQRAVLDVAMGITKGIPDTFLSMPKHGYNGLYVEFKTPEGKLSQVQKEVIALLETQNYLVLVINNVECFKASIMWYLS